MRKIWLLIIVIILAAIVLFAPYVSGIMTEKSLEKAIKTMSFAPSYKVEITKYDRGWFRSKVEMQLFVFNPNSYSGHNQSKMIKVGKIEGWVQHGPLLITMNDKDEIHWDWGRGFLYYTYVFPKEAIDDLNHAIRMVPQIHGTTLFTLTGNYDWHLKLEPINFFKKQNDLKFTYPGAQLKLQTNSTFNILDTDLTSMPLTVEDNKGNKLLMGHVSAVSKTNRDNPYHLWVGNGELTWQGFQFSMKGQQYLDISGVTLNSSQSLDGKYVGGEISGKIESITVLNEKYIDNNFKFSITNLNAEASGEFIEFMKNIQREELSPEEFNMKMMTQIPTMIKMFADGVKVNLNIDTKAPEGLISLAISAELGKVPHEGGIQAAEGMITKANAVLDFSMPKALLMRYITSEKLSVLKIRMSHGSADLQNLSPNELMQRAKSDAEDEYQKVLQSKFIKENGDKVEVHVNYKDQNLKVNDVAVPLGQFFH